jgi:hypothetical protein
LLVIGGCGSQEGARYALPGKVGASGEIVIVCEDMFGLGLLVIRCVQFLANLFRFLPQYEPWFDLVHLTPESFDRFWKPHRNIIDLELADRVDTQTFQTFQFTGRNMLVTRFTLKGPRALLLRWLLSLADRGEEMRSILHRTEVDRFGQLMALDENEVIKAELGGTDAPWN